MLSYLQSQCEFIWHQIEEKAPFQTGLGQAAAVALAGAEVPAPEQDVVHLRIKPIHHETHSKQYIPLFIAR